MAVQIRGISPQCYNETWSLEITSDKVVVRDATGRPLATFDADEAVERLQMPSFLGNVKHFGIHMRGSLHLFTIRRAGLREVKRLINRTIVSSGPEAIESVKNRANRDAFIGVACAGAGVAATMASYQSAANDPRSTNYLIFYGLIFVGLVGFAKGIVGFIHYLRLRRLARTDDAIDGR